VIARIAVTLVTFMAIAVSCQPSPAKTSSDTAAFSDTITSAATTASTDVSASPGASTSPAKSTSPSRTASDSAVGIIAITGTAFEKQLVLRSGNNTINLSTAASDSAALSRMGDVEVLVTGKQGPRKFEVSRFKALRVGGNPVVDGVLRDDGGRLSLMTAGGRIPLGNPPSALRQMIGARIWIGGPLDKGPNVYGVIVPAP
jgi:hypothetical protein